MKCIDCGSDKVRAKKEAYDASKDFGLPVILVGIEVRICQACGARGPVIPAMADLLRTLVGLVARKSGRLAPGEVTFLRGMTDRNGRELAKLLGSTPSAVSRWERGATPIGTQSDKLLRVAALMHHRVPDYTLPDLQLAASLASSKPLRFTLAFSRVWVLVEDSSKAA